MRTFGWTIGYTLSLSGPQFIALVGLATRARKDEAIDTIYSGYAAAKYGGKCSDALFNGRGSLFLEDSPSADYDNIDDGELEAARKRMAAILKAREIEATEDGNDI